jgi:hypothetical protein
MREAIAHAFDRRTLLRLALLAAEAACHQGLRGGSHPKTAGNPLFSTAL